LRTHLLAKWSLNTKKDQKAKCVKKREKKEAKLKEKSVLPVTSPAHRNHFFSFAIALGNLKKPLLFAFAFACPH